MDNHVVHAKDRPLREFRELRHASGSLERFLAEDVVWHVPGRSLIAGDYRGKADVLAYLDRRQALAGGTFVWDIREIMAGEKHLVQLTTGRANCDRRDYEWDALGPFRVEHGLIAECRLVPVDLYRFDEAWS